MNQNELIALASSRSKESRAGVFSTVGNLIADGGAEYGETERALAAEILRHLMGEVEAKLRWELATKIAHHSDVPADLIVELASDQSEVAYPVLKSSPLLSDADLVRIVRTRAQGHQLAVARRDALSSTVSQALIDSDDPLVIVELLGNSGATLTDEMLAFLAEESQWQTLYQKPLLTRQDLPLDIAKRVYWWVAAPLRQHICNRYGIEAEIIDSELDLIVDDHLRDLAQRRTAPTRTQKVVDELQEQGSLTIAFLTDALSKGESDLFLEGFAQMTGLRVSMVNQLVSDPTGRSLAVSCCALGMTDVEFLALYRLTRHERGKARKITSGESARVLQCYARLNANEATKQLRSWRRNPEYLTALQAIAEQKASGACSPTPQDD